MRFSNRVALVTGGGQGIGRATCDVLARDGAAVAIAEIDPVSGQRAADEIVAAGGRAVFIPMDVTSETSVRDGVAAAVTQLGPIQILVNNAAVFVLKGLEATPDEWQRSLQTNIIGPSLVTRYVVPHMRAAGGGAIVLLGSISSFIAQPQFITYSTTKAAMNQMARCLALDLAPDIRVNAICPGTIWTPIVERLTREEGLDREAADKHPNWGGAYLLKRLGDSSEVAKAIAFLVSDDASFITGTSLMVDGGYTTV